MKMKNTRHQYDHSSINFVFVIHPKDDLGGDREYLVLKKVRDRYQHCMLEHSWLNANMTTNAFKQEPLSQSFVDTYT